jgi:hypothetical protein
MTVPRNLGHTYVKQSLNIVKCSVQSTTAVQNPTVIFPQSNIFSYFYGAQGIITILMGTATRSYPQQRSSSPHSRPLFL